MTPDPNRKPTRMEMRPGDMVAIRMACMDLLSRNLRADRGMKATGVIV